MYTDLNLKLASTLSTLDNILGDEPAIDLAAQGEVRDLVFTGGADNARHVALLVTLTTEIGSVSNPANVVEFRAISSPWVDGSGLIDLTKTGLTGVDASDIFTLAGHGLGIGQPVYLTALTGGSALTGSNYYFVHPLTADTFTLHTTIALARSGASPVNLGSDVTAGTVNVAPTVHASTGSIAARELNVAGRQLVAPFRPMMASPIVDERGFIGAVGPNQEFVCHRYLGVQLVKGGTTSGGVFDAELVLCGSHGEAKFYPTAFVAK